MNTTRIPGFSAEASLYRNCGRYYGGPVSELGKGEEGMVHPAMWAQFFCNDWRDTILCCLVPAGPGPWNCFTPFGFKA
jgi:hypothetical protein